MNTYLPSVKAVSLPPANVIRMQKLGRSLQQGAIITIVLLYTLYAFAYASTSYLGDYKAFLALGMLALMARLPAKQTAISKGNIILFLCFIGLSTANALFNHSSDVFLIIESVAMLLLACTIVGTFFVAGASEFKVIRWCLFGCFFLLVVMALLAQSGVPVKRALPTFIGFAPGDSIWNQKYYAFWLGFLTWGAFSLFWKRSTVGSVLSIAIIVLTGVMLFTGYSDSAKIGFAVSIFTFIVMHFRWKYWYRVWQVILVLYIAILPFALSLLWPSLFRIFGSTNVDKINDRIVIYRFTTNEILNRWIWGYGFGASGSILAPLTVPTGGHPHNIVLLFWLEFGIFGACFLAIATLLLLSFINKQTLGQDNGPIAWALFAFGLIIFSFSFDIWLPSVVLTYCMWLSIIVLICSQPKATDEKLLHSDGLLSRFLRVGP